MLRNVDMLSSSVPRGASAVPVVARRLLDGGDMGSIQIKKQHHLGRGEAHRRVEQLEPELKQKYGVQLDWHGDRADVSGSRLSGQLVVDDSELSIQLKIGLPLVPVQAKIRSALEQRLAHALA
jgi:putative polyhydroxyalkanoate system protein